MNDNSYINWVSMSDNALSETIGNFIKHHRLNQNRTQEDVAKAASISRSTLSLLEKGQKISLNNLIKVLRVLDLLYIMDIFQVKEEISPIEYAKMQKNKKKRARNERKINSEEDLGW